MDGKSASAVTRISLLLGAPGDQKHGLSARGNGIFNSGLYWKSQWRCGRI